ncbi:chymotrypsinogen A-like [Liolophura sinensis]|uniref:chymotrypsinogen A-like n=1 Tax=Liolophura sinensis TaxID=3198878 RepID=UPI00315976D5
MHSKPRVVLLMFTIALLIHVNVSTVLNRARRLIDGEDMVDGLPTVGVLAYKNERTQARPYFILCTLVLLDKDWVLTSAHCLDESATPLREGETLYIVLGLTDNSWAYSPSDVQERGVFEQSQHPEYCARFLLHHDITLMKVSIPFTLNDRVQPIELPPDDIEDSETGTKCNIVGWGIENFPITEESFPRYIKQGRMSLGSCENQFGNLLGDDHLCAVGTSVTPCSGDSGAPVFCDIGGKSYFIGIDSFGQFENCEDNPLQVLTRISYFLDFIEDTMEEETDD